MEESRVESKDMAGFAEALHNRRGGAGRIDVDPDSVRNDVARLVLTLVKLIHELLERQAIRRMDAGGLSEEEEERLGLALMRQAEELERIRKIFGLSDEELNLDLGPLGKLL